MHLKLSAAWLCLALTVAFAGEGVPDNAVRLPDGDSRAGWEAFVKNDFAAAGAAFRTALEKNTTDLDALEGLRAVALQLGDLKQAQALNLRMLHAGLNHPLANIFAVRAMDSLSYVESRREVLDSFLKAAQASPQPALSSNLKDHASSLHLQLQQPEPALKLVQGLGYVDRWLYIAGPFGGKDRNNTIDRRFAPERGVKPPDFTDESGDKVDVKLNQPVPSRDIHLGRLVPGARGVFYLLTNLQSDNDAEVILGVNAPRPYRAYLRGQPLLSEPGEEQYQRNGGDLIRTRLLKGANPLLLKLGNTGPVTVRVMSLEYGPAEGVTTATLPENALAQEISALRGVLYSQKVTGSTAEFFLKRIPAAERKGNELLPLLKTPLTLPEAIWFDAAAQRENDVKARVTLARLLAASFPDSAGVLDIAANILPSAGYSAGNSQSREPEEAKQLRERALKLLPTSHTHLLALYDFYNERSLPDQAVEHIKACVAAHPESPIALARLGSYYQGKQFLVEAERLLEKAAQLEPAWLPLLVYYHELHGNRARARELEQQQAQLGQLDLVTQFDRARRRGELDAAAKLLAQLAKFPRERDDELLPSQIANLTERGDLASAYQIQKNYFQSMTKNHQSRRATLQSLVELALRIDRDDDAKALLKAFLDENPGDFELRRHLSELEGSAVVKWWEPYDVNVAQIDTSRYNNKNYPAANHAWIVDFMVTKIAPDFSRESYVHIAQKVLNTAGINELSEVLVRAQRQNIVYVRTLNPDGAVFEPQNVHDFNLSQSASLYKVGPGSILEHAYLEGQSTDKDDAAFNMAFNFNAIDAPRAVSRWTVLIANEVKDKLIIRKTRPELLDEKITPGPPGYTVYQWQNKQVEGIKFEPFMPNENDQEVIPLVSLETAERPFRASRWLQRQERDFIPADAKAQAAKLAAPIADEAAKFDAIVKWVQENIQPGGEAWTLEDVWSSRTGSAMQMMTLAREMAQSVGLRVRTAYVNSSYFPGRNWKPKTARRLWEPAELAGFGSGGQMLVQECNIGADRWLQFMGRTPRHFNPEDISPNQHGALALTVGEDGARIKRVRGEDTGLTAATQRLEISMDAQGAGNVLGALQIFGAFAGNLREALTDPRRAAQVRESMVRYTWPKIGIKQIEVHNAERNGKPLVFVYTGAIPGLAVQADNALSLQPFPGRVRLLELRGPPERQHDLLIKQEMYDVDHTLTYIAPEGHGWVEVPDDLFICNEFGFYFTDFNVRGRTLVCTRSYLLPAQRIAPEKYPQLLDFIRQVAAHTQQRIGYAPLKAETFGPTRAILSNGYASYGEDKPPQK